MKNSHPKKLFLLRSRSTPDPYLMFKIYCQEISKEAGINKAALNYNKGPNSNINHFPSIFAPGNEPKTTPDYVRIINETVDECIVEHRNVISVMEYYNKYSFTECISSAIKIFKTIMIPIFFGITTHAEYVNFAYIDSRIKLPAEEINHFPIFAFAAPASLTIYIDSRALTKLLVSFLTNLTIYKFETEFTCTAEPNKKETFPNFPFNNNNKTNLMECRPYNKKSKLEIDSDYLNNATFAKLQRQSLPDIGENVSINDVFMVKDMYREYVGIEEKQQQQLLKVMQEWSTLMQRMYTSKNRMFFVLNFLHLLLMRTLADIGERERVVSSSIPVQVVVSEKKPQNQSATDKRKRSSSSSSSPYNTYNEIMHCTFRV